jgi:hypothetical protein
VTNLRRLLSVALVATCITAVQSEAAGGKRRSVQPRTPPNQIEAEITVTVIDNVTGAPVANATVEAGETTRATDENGKATLKGVRGTGSINILVKRSGYTEKHASVTEGGKQSVTVRLDPRATVTVRKTDNTVIQLDDDSVEFGYPDAFSGYRSSSNEDFCRPDGTAIVVNRSEITRINGPATMTPNAPCCPSNVPVEKINVTFKAGGSSDLFFADTCVLTHSIDLIGRNHVTGQVLYIPFTQVAEVVFP